MEAWRLRSIRAGFTLWESLTPASSGSDTTTLPRTEQPGDLSERRMKGAENR
jgi:hypothetical protein